MSIKDLQYFAENFGWLIAIAFVLVLNGDKVAIRLGTFIPPLANWLSQRETEKAVETSARLSSVAQLQAQDAKMQEKLIGILDQTLTHTFEIQERLSDRIDRLEKAVERNNGVLTSLNMTLSKLASAVGKMSRGGDG